jgi:hypothetical protein
VLPLKLYSLAALYSLCYSRVIHIIHKEAGAKKGVAAAYTTAVTPLIYIPPDDASGNIFRR